MFRSIALSIIGVTFALLMITSATAVFEDKITITAADLKPQDQALLKDINTQLQGYDKDMQLAQAQYDLARSKAQRMQEVTIPALIAQIRKDYNLPESDWQFTPNPFGFNKIIKSGGTK